MTMADRIKERRKAMNMTQEELAAKLGLQKSAIAKYENGRVQNIKRPVIGKMASVLECSPYYLMALDEQEATDHPDLRPAGVQRFPVLGSVSCGEPRFMAEEKEILIDVANPPKADFVLTAKGESMINIGIHDGDIVFIHKQPTVENGQVAVVAIGEDALLKRFYYYPEKQLVILKPENPAYDDIVLIGHELEDVHVLGRAVKYQGTIR